MLIFEARPGRAGIIFRGCAADIAEADLLVFFVQREVRMLRDR